MYGNSAALKISAAVSHTFYSLVCDVLAFISTGRIGNGNQPIVQPVN
jgi:hypothetical protein